MSIRQNFELMAAGDLSADATSNPALVDRFDGGFNVQCVTAGSATGTLQLQATSDAGVIPEGGPSAATGLTNWVNVLGAAQTVTAAGVYMLNCSDQNYRWARVKYTRTAGTGTLNIRVNGKGAT